MSDEDFQLGGTPPLVPGPSLEAEEKAMRGGRGGFFAILAAAALLLLGGVGFLIFGGDGTEPHRTLGRNVNGLEAQYFRGFWGCVFQGDERIQNNEDLVRQIHDRAGNGGARFAQHVRTQCLGLLAELEPRLRALIPPTDMVEAVNELVRATEQLRGAWSDYLAHVEGGEGPYDRDEAGPLVDRIARGWFDFERTQAQIDRDVATALGQ